MGYKVVYEHSGKPTEVVRVVESDRPPATQRGQVLVRVTAFSIHPGDLVGIAGPFAGGDGEMLVPGAEATGTVEGIGPDTEVGTSVSVGARVTVFMVLGAWQQWVLAPSELVVAVPGDMADEVAAQMMINPLTAVILRRAGERTAGLGYDGVAIQSAAGSSVARLLTFQMHRNPGGLINLVRSQDGAERLRDRLPEVPVIVTADPGWQNEVRSAANGRPIAAAFDAVAGELAGVLLNLLSAGGTLFTYGAMATEPMSVHANSLLPKELRIEAVSIGRWWATASEERRVSDIATAQALVRDAADHLDVAGVYKLDELHMAIEHVSRAGKAGMVVVATG
jgi:NADPH:quinone reductase-like Zn-dependent oxidoreductase